MNINYLDNPNGGPVLGYSEGSGVKIIRKDNCYFKNHSRTGELLPYEDWRLTPEERAKDLAGRLSLGQMAGLMLHKLVVSGEALLRYETLEETFIHSFAIMSDGSKSIDDICDTYNSLQQRMESMELGIPALLTSEGINVSDDSMKKSDLPETGASPLFSKWPVPLGIAATFDPQYAEAWGSAAAREYRAIGVTVA